MFGLSPFELAVIAVIAVVLFGGNLPDVARKLGSSYSQLRRGINDVQQQFRDVQNEANRAFAIEEKTKKNSLEKELEPEQVEPSAPKFTPPE